MRNIMDMYSAFYSYKEPWLDALDYLQNFRENLLLKERKRIRFNHRSRQPYHRNYFVNYMRNICIDRKFSLCCLYLAIYILDIFMDNNLIRPHQLLLLSNVCILIAAKFEEQSFIVPKIAALNYESDNIYEHDQYIYLENLILQFFDFYVLFPTAAHFAFLYFHVTISLSDLSEAGDFPILFFCLHMLVIDYLDKVVNNVHFLHCCTPSLIAASIIAASRIKIGLTPWTSLLENFTKYKFVDLQLVMGFISYVCD